MLIAQRRAVLGRADAVPSLVAVFAVVMLFFGAVTVAARLTTAWDGTEWSAQPDPFSQPIAEGLLVNPVGAHSRLLLGERVVAVDGVLVGQLRRGPFDPGRDLAGGALEYMVESEAGGRVVRQPLAPFPAAFLLEEWPAVLTIGAWLAVAVYVFRRRPRDPAAQLMVAMGAAFVPGVFWRWVGVSDLVGGPVLPLAAAYMPVYFFGIASIAGLVAVFPRPTTWASRHGRLIAVAVAAPALAVLVVLVLAQLGGTTMVEWGGSVAALESLLYLGVVGVLAVAVPLRFRQLGDSTDRRAFLLVVGSVALASVLVVAVWIAPTALLGAPLLPPSTYGLFGLPIPIALGVAILRYGAFDLERIVNRSLVYGGATAAIAAIYVLLVGVAALNVQEQFGFAVALLATALVILIAQPIRDGLQRAVNRLMYGDRDDPYESLARLGERLESARAPRELPALADTVAEAVATSLRLPYVAIELRDDGRRRVIAAARGEPVAQPVAVPLVHHAELLGRLLLAPRPGEDGFSETDERLLTALAGQVSTAIRNAELDAALRRSRERLVATREEERRRLRRDLHDGLGPTLAGTLLQLRAARAALAEDPRRASELIDALEAETRQAIAEVRRMARDLRPPAIDDLGLLGALRERADHFSVDPNLEVALDVPDELPPLPAAVEVAAYRIALEALANVARHARAEHCRITLEVGDVVLVTIEDDGVGLAEGATIGVGLRSMRERAAEVGGALEVGPRPGGGTVVTAQLPLVVEEAVT